VNARNRLAVGLAEGHSVMLVTHGSRTLVSWVQSWNLNLLTGNNDIVVEGSHLLPETLSGSLLQTMFTTDVSFPFNKILSWHIKMRRIMQFATAFVQTTKILEILTLPRRGFRRNKL